MKELTIEQKAKAYDEALKAAVVAHKDEDRHLKAALERIFPELKEEMNNKIKACIKMCLTDVNEQRFKDYGTTLKDCLAWLEKQGEQKPICLLDNSESNVKFPFKAKVKRNGKIVTIHGGQLSMDGKEWIKYQSDLEDRYMVYEPEDLELVCNIEQLTDKAEPKFKVGDWVVCTDQGGYEHVRQITNIDIAPFSSGSEKSYRYWTSDLTWFGDSYDARLWTIKDAKPGDVLVDKSHVGKCVFIFKEARPSDIKTDVNNPLAIIGYCGINHIGFTSQLSGLGFGDTVNCTYYPAAKEQRDTLFAKMKEAGYIFDFEKKELKKVNKNTDVGHEYFSDLLEKDDCDNIDDYAYQCAYCMSHDWMKDTATWDDVERACKLGAEWNERHCKYIWSDGDVYNFKLILSTISQDQDLSLKTKDKLTSWLKSIKQRYTWRPSDAQMEALADALSLAKSCGEERAFDLRTLYEQLKKLTE